MRIGVDEAGYGPNLGPLVVGATAWRVTHAGDLYEQLADVVGARPHAGQLQIADSKAVYQPGGGLAGLEAPVFAAMGDTPRCWSTLIDAVGADPSACVHEQPWRSAWDPALPLDMEPEAIGHARDRLHDGLERSAVAPPQLLARIVYPAEFNDLVDRHDSKGAALSHTTLGLVRRVLDKCGIDIAAPAEPVAITLDKHGGRNRYAALIQHWLPEAPLVVVEESRPVSRYRVGQRIELVFRAKGEAALPVALASMTAKLLREIAMRGFNTFWAERVPGIRPTAGYPGDAKRFKAQIATEQKKLGIEDRVLWRNR